MRPRSFRAAADPSRPGVVAWKKSPSAEPTNVITNKKYHRIVPILLTLLPLRSRGSFCKNLTWDKIKLLGMVALCFHWFFCDRFLCVLSNRLFRYLQTSKPVLRCVRKTSVWTEDFVMQPIVPAYVLPVMVLRHHFSPF